MEVVQISINGWVNEQHVAQTSEMRASHSERRRTNTVHYCCSWEMSTDNIQTWRAAYGTVTWQIYGRCAYEDRETGSSHNQREGAGSGYVMHMGFPFVQMETFQNNTVMAVQHHESRNFHWVGHLNWLKWQILHNTFLPFLENNVQNKPLEVDSLGFVYWSLQDPRKHCLVPSGLGGFPVE